MPRSLIETDNCRLLRATLIACIEHSALTRIYEVLFNFNVLCIPKWRTGKCFAGLLFVAVLLLVTLAVSS